MILKVAAGVAVGYVLGAWAGRERYEQITAVARRVSGGGQDQSAVPSPSPGTAGVVVDDLPLEAAEADVVEQSTPMVDHRDEPALAPVPLESDPDDVREQRRS